MPRWNVHFNTRVQTANPELVGLVARARTIASFVKEVPVPPHLQERFNRLNILRAVQGTTGIEGTNLTEEEAQRVLDAPPATRVLHPSREREEQEVKNAGAMMHRVKEILAKDPNMPLSESLIRELHAIVTRDIPYPNNAPGQYRRHNAVAGDYLASPQEDVPRLMDDFIRWFHTGTPQQWDPIIRAVIAHFYVVSIHPFGEGNGRTSRGVESFLLHQAGINARGFYSLANFYYRMRAEYVQQLTAARFQTDPDLTPFVLFALRGLVEELEAVNAEILTEIRNVSFRDYARAFLQGEKKLGKPGGDRLLALLDAASRDSLAAGSISLRDIRAGRHPLSPIYRDVSVKTFTRDLNYLFSHKLIIVQDAMMRPNLSIMDEFKAE